MKDENSNRKPGWIIGFALIIFLILVLGSVIGLSVTRNGINNFLGKNPNSGNSVNYIVYEDGRKENNSSSIVNYEFEDDGLIFSHFIIETMNDDERSTLSIELENTLEEDKTQKTIMVTFLDDMGKELMQEVAVTTPSLIPSLTKTIIVVPLQDDVVNASKIEVRALEEDVEDELENENSGEVVEDNNITSGEE